MKILGIFFIVGLIFCIVINTVAYFAEKSQKKKVNKYVNDNNE